MNVIILCQLKSGFILHFYVNRDKSLADFFTRMRNGKCKECWIIDVILQAHVLHGTYVNSYIHVRIQDTVKPHLTITLLYQPLIYGLIV